MKANVHSSERGAGARKYALFWEGYQIFQGYRAAFAAKKQIKESYLDEESVQQDICQVEDCLRRLLSKGQLSNGQL